jgi:hypothetical protein
MAFNLFMKVLDSDQVFHNKILQVSAFRTVAGKYISGGYRGFEWVENGESVHIDIWLVVPPMQVPRTPPSVYAQTPPKFQIISMTEELDGVAEGALHVIPDDSTYASMRPAIASAVQQFLSNKFDEHTRFHSQWSIHNLPTPEWATL